MDPIDIPLVLIPFGVESAEQMLVGDVALGGGVDYWVDGLDALCVKFLLHLDDLLGSLTEREWNNFEDQHLFVI